MWHIVPVVGMLVGMGVVSLGVVGWRRGLSPEPQAKKSFLDCKPQGQGRIGAAGQVISSTGRTVSFTGAPCCGSKQT